MKTQLVSLLLIGMMLQTQAQTNLIPLPVSYESLQGSFKVGHHLAMDITTRDARALQYADQFREILTRSGVEVTLERVEKPDAAHQVILVAINKEPLMQLGGEGYTLEVTENTIRLSANEAGGIFNGLQTLRQLLPPGFENMGQPESGPVTIQCCKIEDFPRFGWRGLMLDVSRHFFTVEEVKAYLDKMSQYKFNVFHWHLTDDEGWRIEIKSLPKLTEVGAWRVERFGRFGETRPYPQPGEKATYGGFYTHEQIREVVEYAAARNITILPEIDLPGHSMAALAAYPELSTKKEEKFVNPGSNFAEWYGNGEFKMLIENTVNPSDEKVYEFIDKVFTEVAALFPGDYIHMGGDECYKGYWEADPQVQKFMAKNGIKDSHELQSYFVKRVEKIVSSKGKKLIGWDEILEGGLAKGAAVMSWRGMKGGIEAATMGHEVVMTPTTFAYLDYTQGDPSVENSIYEDLSLEKTYRFEPLPEDVDARYILGGQGNLWTEVIPTLPFAFYMTYPRAFALAEIFWSPASQKEWNNFIARTEAHFTRFDADHTSISKAVYEPSVSLKMEDGKMICQLKNSIPGAEIWYTVDNTYPVQFGQQYGGPFVIPEGNLSLRTQTFRDGIPLGRELIISRKELERRLK